MQKWIRLVGLDLQVSIGIHEFEKRAPQAYRLDIGLQLNDDYAVWLDAIEETVNYDALRSRVKSHLESKHFNLQETLIQEVIAICFALDTRVVAVDIATAKTSVYPDCESVGLHYMLSRSEYETL